MNPTCTCRHVGILRKQLSLIGHYYILIPTPQACPTFLSRNHFPMFPDTCGWHLEFALKFQSTQKSPDSQIPENFTPPKYCQGEVTIPLPGFSVMPCSTVSLRVLLLSALFRDCRGFYFFSFSVVIEGFQATVSAFAS